MSSPSQVTVIPLMGPFHTRLPLYNVVHAAQLVQASGPDALALAPLAPGALADPNWQSTPEIALPHTIVPWARARKLPIYEVGWPQAARAEKGDDADRFERYLSEYDDGKRLVREVQAALQPVKELLTRAPDLGRIRTELLPVIDAYNAKRREAYGEGPGTDWLEERADSTAKQVLALGHARVTLLVGIDELSAVEAALEGHVELLAIPAPAAPSDAARRRTLLDVALRGEVTDPAGLLDQLRTLHTPEARYVEAEVLLNNGHAAEALNVLREAAKGDFQEPYYLPGFLLTRLGQLLDLAGERDQARRSYRGALALSYVPPEAAEVARQGLEAPFEWPYTDEPEGEDGAEP